jgi:GT2 family glycosyltransferase
MKARGIHHIPKVLYHWRKIPGSAAAVVDAKPRALEAAHRALEDHLRQRGVDAVVEPGKLTGYYRVRYAIQGAPLISLCIPTNDSWSAVKERGQINLLENFVKSIAAKTEYKQYEIVICDNANLSERTRAALRDIDYRLVSYTGPQKPFNFASKANFLFKQAKGSHIVLLNDDLEVISPEWVTALLEFSQQREVGAVGGRLLFPDNHIQHVGIALGVNDGVAHLYHNYPADFVGYNGFTHIIRNYSAVTGACMMTRREVLENIDGFDERFALDYNDINYCLSVLDGGYRIVYTPYCELYHFEGQTASRRVANREETTLFQRRWMKYIENDPYYNPNLTRHGIDLSARQTPIAMMAAR